MLATRYDKEFCVSPDFSLGFIARLMKAGFLVMSASFNEPDDNNADNSGDNPANNHAEGPFYVLLPKLHLVRSALFFENLHIKKSIRRFLKQYQLRPDADFELIVDRCVAIHGPGWLTPPLVEAIKNIRQSAPEFGVYPTSFALYHDGKLVAGEFGIRVGRVYTSYSGYYDEDNAGTAQLILAAQYLRDSGDAFFDLGMPLDYKADLGAVDISPEEFVRRFREAAVKEFSPETVTVSQNSIKI
jgi:Leu/Phe-tRNA-protein transferase